MFGVRFSATNGNVSSYPVQLSAGQELVYYNQRSVQERLASWRILVEGRMFLAREIIALIRAKTFKIRICIS